MKHPNPQFTPPHHLHHHGIEFDMIFSSQASSSAASLPRLSAGSSSHLSDTQTHSSLQGAAETTHLFATLSPFSPEIWGKSRKWGVKVNVNELLFYLWSFEVLNLPNDKDKPGKKRKCSLAVYKCLQVMKLLLCCTVFPLHCFQWEWLAAKRSILNWHW